MNITDTPHAVFLVAIKPCGDVAAVKMNTGRVGLPGGKLEGGETDKQALLRECKEEGWEVSPLATLNKLKEEFIEGKRVRWYTVDHEHVQKLEVFVERHRCTTAWVPAGELTQGLGNEGLVTKCPYCQRAYPISEVGYLCMECLEAVIG